MYIIVHGKIGKIKREERCKRRCPWGGGVPGSVVALMTHLPSRNENICSHKNLYVSVIAAVFIVIPS